jgi:hypothetical protein
METEKDWERGRKLLKELLPWARAEVKKGDHSVKMESALGKATAPHVTEANLDALMIYPAPKGGWHADVVFKSTPPGVPNCMGTPVGHPLRTRAEAEDVGKRLLVSMLKIAEMNQTAPTQERVFLICGWSVRLPAEVYEHALGQMPEMRNGYGSPLQAAARVEQVLDELCPEGFNGEAFDDWPTERKAYLLSVLVTATLSGLYTWPWRRDAPPMDDPNV